MTKLFTLPHSFVAPLAMSLVALCLVPVAAAVGCSTSDEPPTCVSSDQQFYDPPYAGVIWTAELTGDWDFDEHPVSDAGTCGHTAGQFYSMGFSIPKTGTYVAAAMQPSVDSVLSIRRARADLACEEVLDCYEVRGALPSGMAGATSDDASGSDHCRPIEAELGLGGSGSEGIAWCFPTDIEVRAELEEGDEVVVTLAHVNADETDGTGAIYFYEETE